HQPTSPPAHQPTTGWPPTSTTATAERAWGTLLTVTAALGNVWGGGSRPGRLSTGSDGENTNASGQQCSGARRDSGSTGKNRTTGDKENHQTHCCTSNRPATKRHSHCME